MYTSQSIKNWKEPLPVFFLKKNNEKQQKSDTRKLNLLKEQDPQING